MSNEIESLFTLSDADKEVRRKVMEDIMHFGWGLCLTNEDGSLRYIDPLSEEGNRLWEQSKQTQP